MAKSVERFRKYDSCWLVSTLNQTLKHARGNRKSTSRVSLLQTKLIPAHIAESSTTFLSFAESHLAAGESQGKRSKVRKVRLSAGGGDNFATEFAASAATTTEKLTLREPFLQLEVATVASLCALQTDWNFYADQVEPLKCDGLGARWGLVTRFAPEIFCARSSASHFSSICVISFFAGN